MILWHCPMPLWDNRGTPPPSQISILWPIAEFLLIPVNRFGYIVAMDASQRQMFNYLRGNITQKRFESILRFFTNQRIFTVRNCFCNINGISLYRYKWIGQSGRDEQLVGMSLTVYN